MPYYGRVFFLKIFFLEVVPFDCGLNISSTNEFTCCRPCLAKTALNPFLAYAKKSFFFKILMSFVNILDSS